MNTAYFQGTWQMGFDENLIENKPFHLLNKSVKNYPFLSRQGTYNYTENSQLKALELPYGDGRFSFYVLLPKAENGLENIVKDLTVKKWQKLLSKFQETEGLLELPRFSLNYEVDLTHSLKSLGLSTMFEPSQAKFSALSSHPTYINGIKHQTFLEINEQGIKSPEKDNFIIETASVTTSKPQFSFVVDRPFLCIIRDNQTGNILFMGMIVEP
jgi:serine protease inhibitor